MKFSQGEKKICYKITLKKNENNTHKKSMRGKIK